ncbi:MAG: IclR family transcriptional regulator [Methyloligellaceae bacterium]
MADEAVEQNTSGGVAAVDRAFAIISALEGADTPRTLSEISRSTGLYKSTILRIMESLLRAGYIMRIEDSKYTLGPTVMRLGIAYERTNPLRHHVLPILHELVEAGSESPSFHIIQSEDERLCLFRLDSHHSTLDRVRAGDRLPLRQGAAGKVLLAFTGAKGKEFNKIRTELFARSLGERDPECAGVAAPVFGSENNVLGALSLSGPRKRFGPAGTKEMKPQLHDAARKLSLALGGSYPE